MLMIKAYYNLINTLLDKNNTTISEIHSSKWLNHFTTLNEVDESYRNRLLQLQEKVPLKENSISFNELDFLISSTEIFEAIYYLKCNISAWLESISNYMIRYDYNALLPYEKTYPMHVCHMECILNHGVKDTWLFYINLGTPTTQIIIAV